MKFISRWRYWNRSRRFARTREKQECRFVSSGVKTGDTVFDIGANKGALTFLFSNLVGANGSVFAFEPQPEMIAELEKMSQAVRFQNVTVCPVALSNSAGNAVLHVPPDHTCASLETRHAGQKFDVKLETLDHYLETIGFQGGVDFIKCDVEGHELAVFQGAGQTLKNHQPILLFESFRSNAEFESDPVFQYLMELGYHGFGFCDDQLKRLDLIECTDAPYNFVFLSAEKHSLKSCRPPYGVASVKHAH